MLRQAFRTYVVSLHPRNLKKVPKEQRPSWFLMFYWLVLNPMIVGSQDKIGENYLFFLLDTLIKFFPLLLMWWSNLLGRIYMPKAMFFAPMQKEERKAYINHILLIKIGIPLLLGMILEIIRGLFFEINIIKNFVTLFIQFSFGIGYYICNTYTVNKYGSTRYIYCGIRDKNGVPKTAWLNVLNIGMAFALLVGLEISDFKTNMTFFDAFLLGFFFMLLFIFDILIIKTQYRSMIKDSCDYELNIEI